MTLQAAGDNWPECGDFDVLILFAGMRDLLVLLQAGWRLVPRRTDQEVWEVISYRADCGSRSDAEITRRISNTTEEQQNDQYY